MSDTPSFPNNPGGEGGQWQSASAQPPAASTGNTTLYIVLSVLQLLCCNTIFGIIGLVLSIQANSRFSSGDVAGGQAKLKTAKTVLIVGAVIGVILIAIGVSLSLAGDTSSDL